MSDDDEGVSDTRNDQDGGQDVHEKVASGVIANLVGYRESRNRQHEMG
jgi:hypothetical protein